MSLKESPVTSKLLICVENCNIGVSGTNPADTQACSQCSDPATTVWQCIQQNKS